MAGTVLATTQGNITLVELARSGADGAVYIGHNGEKIFAVKTILGERTLPYQLEYLAFERLTKSKPQPHCHIMEHVLFKETPQLLIAMEAGMADLYSLLSLGETASARELSYQIAVALLYCHENGIAHRDIKPENILLFPDAQLLADPRSTSAAMKITNIAAHLGFKDDKAQKAGTEGATPYEQLHTTMKRRRDLRDVMRCAAQTLWVDPHSSRPMSLSGLKHQEDTAPNPDAASLLQCFFVKLCDFGAVGQAHKPGEPPMGRTPRGTALYAAPEVMSIYIAQNDKQTASKVWPDRRMRKAMATGAYNGFAADAWSFGVTLFAMASGRTMWRVALPHCSTFRSFVLLTQPDSVQYHVMGPQSRLWHEAGGNAFEWPSFFSPALRHLITWCLMVNPNDRPSMQQVANHPWFTCPTWIPGSPWPQEKPHSEAQQVQSVPAQEASRHHKAPAPPGTRTTPALASPAAPAEATTSTASSAAQSSAAAGGVKATQPPQRAAPMQTAPPPRVSSVTSRVSPPRCSCSASAAHLTLCSAEASQCCTQLH